MNTGDDIDVGVGWVIVGQPKESVCLKTYDSNFDHNSTKIAFATMFTPRTQCPNAIPLTIEILDRATGWTKAVCCVTSNIVVLKIRLSGAWLHAGALVEPILTPIAACYYLQQEARVEAQLDHPRRSQPATGAQGKCARPCYPTATEFVERLAAFVSHV
eukprot:COSAG02_NODE_10933_length_1829_cov_9.120231_2_plen_159_part_00